MLVNGWVLGFSRRMLQKYNFKKLAENKMAFKQKDGMQ
jgi:hypothetical protein